MTDTILGLAASTGSFWYPGSRGRRGVGLGPPSRRGARARRRLLGGRPGGGLRAHTARSPDRPADASRDAATTALFGGRGLRPRPSLSADGASSSTHPRASRATPEGIAVAPVPAGRGRPCALQGDRGGVRRRVGPRHLGRRRVVSGVVAGGRGRDSGRRRATATRSPVGRCCAAPTSRTRASSAHLGRAPPVARPRPRAGAPPGSLRALRGQGRPRVELTVDSANLSGATRLYDRSGCGPSSAGDRREKQLR